MRAAIDIQDVTSDRRGVSLKDYGRTRLSCGVQDGLNLFQVVYVEGADGNSPRAASSNTCGKVTSGMEGPSLKESQEWLPAPAATHVR
jgi:hypothetical protein